MSSIKLVTINFTDYSLVTPLLFEISLELNSKIFFNKINLNIDRFYNSTRGQYDASKILHSLESIDETSKAIIFTSVDLFIPIFTFVFGLAKLGGNKAIVSSHRLRNEFYGLPRDDKLLHQRLLKESLHELGHLYGLRHCENYKCVMASSTVADEIDTKDKSYCKTCQLQCLPERMKNSS